jgi:formate dehydrogenase iron-sulfur subunit
MITLYVPCDSAALAAGADDVVDALHHHAEKHGVAIDIQRNSSRGLFWLEPLVEVLTPQGRVAYGPVSTDDVASLFEAGFLNGGTHALGLGLTDQIPYLAKQQRLTFARMGITRPLSLDDYAAHGGWVGLKNAVAMEATAVVQQVLDSGLRGRGGAAFPAGIKWRTVLGTTSAQKYVVCNADEGDSGTFSDRMTMEGDPYMLIEGMAIAGLAVGATLGYIYIRSEYPHAIATMNTAIALAESAGFLGDNVLGSGKAFRIEVRKAAGAYVCGEETAMLGKHRRQARHRSRQTALACLRRLVWPTHRHQQRHHLGQRAHHHGQGRWVLQRLWHGPLHRHLAVPNHRQCVARRFGGTRLRLEPARIVV